MVCLSFSEHELSLEIHLKAIKSEYQKLISTLRYSEHLSYNKSFSVSKIMLSSKSPTCDKCFRPWYVGNMLEASIFSSFIIVLHL